jgi:hypothetical protein
MSAFRTQRNVKSEVIDLADSGDDETQTDDRTPTKAEGGNGVKIEVKAEVDGEDVKPLFRPSPSSDEEPPDLPPPSSQTSVDYVLRRKDFQSSFALLCRLSCFAMQRHLIHNHPPVTTFTQDEARRAYPTSQGTAG